METMATPSLVPALGQKTVDHASSPTSPCSDFPMLDRPSGPLTRVWEPPPRPKPGRKPATDIPPSKRKAQNRLAQRNFRERRAQKISEMEQIMDEQRREQQTLIEKLTVQIAHLKAQHGSVQEELRREREARAAGEREIGRLKEMLLDQKGLVPLPGRARSSLVKAGVARFEDGHGRPAESAREQASSSLICPNKCEPGNCACVDSMITPDPGENHDHGQVGNMGSLGKAETPPHPGVEMEIDMTTTRSKLHEPNNPPSTAAESTILLPTSGSGIENCGFCENSSVCPCREMHESTEQGSNSILDVARTQPDSQSGSTGGSGCSGNPGSCLQCQSDPKSKDFCISFASQVKPTSSARSGIGQTGGCGAINCCQIQQPTSHMRSGSSSSSRNSTGAVGVVAGQLGGNPGGSTVDCATAYNRLKSHPRFDEAMANKEEWMRRLRPIPAPCESSRTAASSTVAADAAVASGPAQAQHLQGRSAYEIDAASVMATFRHFDTRFGTDSRNDWKKEDGGSRR